MAQEAEVTERQTISFIIFKGHAEKLILERRVTFRDKVVCSPAFNITKEDISFLKIDGQV